MKNKQTRCLNISNDFEENSIAQNFNLYPKRRAWFAKHKYFAVWHKSWFVKLEKKTQDFCGELVKGGLVLGFNCS